MQCFVPRLPGPYNETALTFSVPTLRHYCLGSNVAPAATPAQFDHSLPPRSMGNGCKQSSVHSPNGHIQSTDSDNEMMSQQTFTSRCLSWSSHHHRRLPCQWSPYAKAGSYQSASMPSSQTCEEAEQFIHSALWSDKVRLVSVCVWV